MAACRLSSAQLMLKQAIKEGRVLTLFQQKCKTYSTGKVTRIHYKPLAVVI